MKSLTDEELLEVLREGVYTKIPGCDTKLTHYQIIDFDDKADELLICYGGTSELWAGGNELSYCCHILKGKDKNKKWYVHIHTY